MIKAEGDEKHFGVDSERRVSWEFFIHAWSEKTSSCDPWSRRKIFLKLSQSEKSDSHFHVWKMIALEILGARVALKHKIYICHVSWLTADHRLRVSGRMESDTAWALRRGDGGFTAANGHKALRDVTVCDRVRRRPQSTRALGRMDCRTATAPRPMRMEVMNRGFWRFKSNFNLSTLSTVMCLDIKLFSAVAFYCLRSDTI